MKINGAEVISSKEYPEGVKVYVTSDGKKYSTGKILGVNSILLKDTKKEEKKEDGKKEN